MGYLWDNFTSEGIFDFATSTYASLEPWTYPLVILGILGFVYATMNSIIVTIAGIIFAVGIYGVTTDIFVDVPDITLFLYIVSIIGITLLIAMLVIKRRS